MRRIKLTALVLLVTLAVLALTLHERRPTEVPAGPEPRAAQTIPLTDVHPLGANLFLEREVELWKQEKTVEMAADAGIRWAKQHFRWYEIEPERGEYRWQKYDRIVDLYRSHGIEVIARVDWPPTWVEPAPWVPETYQGGGVANFPPANEADYARFVRALVDHFEGRVRFYQLWNEPNLLNEWGYSFEHPVDPAEYTDLLAAGAEAARAADPSVVVLAAPLAITTESTDLRGNMSDLAFLDGMYDAGAAPYFDVLAANAFGMDQPPEAPPDPNVLNFRRTELQREVMVANGDEETAIWLNEYGWNAAPPDLPSPWRQVEEDEQADWTTRGLSWAVERWPWAGVFSVWYFRQWGEFSPDQAVYYFRVVDVDFTPRRLYEPLAQRAEQMRVGSAGVWAERSAPVTVPLVGAEGPPWAWEWAEGALDRNALRARTAGAWLRFTFRGTGVAARVAAASAVPLGVEIDGRVTGEAGAPPVVAPNGGDWTWLTLAEGLPAGEHELRLRVDDPAARLRLDALRVTADPPPPARWPPLALGALAMALTLLLVVDARRAAGYVRL